MPAIFDALPGIDVPVGSISKGLAKEQVSLSTISLLTSPTTHDGVSSSQIHYK